MPGLPPIGAPLPDVVISLPVWVENVVDGMGPLADDDAAMRLAIDLSRENIQRGTGGPFGAVITTSDGTIVGVGVNGVTRLLNSTAHAEMVAIQMAQRPLHVYTLRDHPAGSMTLYSSCEPCAMCLGAVLWSGVGRLVTGARREDAESLGFDEGPVFDASWEHLVRRGIEVRRGVLPEVAREVLQAYREAGGPIY